MMSFMEFMKAFFGIFFGDKYDNHKRHLYPICPLFPLPAARRPRTFGSTQAWGHSEPFSGAPLVGVLQR